RHGFARIRGGSRDRAVASGGGIARTACAISLPISLAGDTSGTTEAAMTHAALVLFSGGQDSTVCLAWALDRFDRVETIGFDYGQRHRVELDCRGTVRDRLCRDFPEWGRRLGDDHLVDLGVLGRISDTALTSDAEIRFSETGLPTTFVPARNLLFFTFAAAVAYRR